MTMRETLEAQQLLWAQKIPKGFDNFFPKGGGGSSAGNSTPKGGEVRGDSVDRSAVAPGAGRGDGGGCCRAAAHNHITGRARELCVGMMVGWSSVRGSPL